MDSSSALDRRRAIVGRFFQVAGDGVDPLLAALEPHTVRGGEWLFREGEPGDALFLIVHGRLQVWRGSRPGEGENAELLGELVPGQSVGEISLLTGGFRSASVRAIRDSLLLRMDRERFEHLAATHPGLCLGLTAQIAELLRDRTAARPSMSRGLASIAVLPMGEGRTVLRFAAELTAALRSHGTVQHLDAASTRGRSAKVLAEWLHEEESRHRFLVLEAEPRSSAWSELVLRQADVVILVGDASQTPTAGLGNATSGNDAVRRILVLLHPDEQVAGGAAWLEVLPASEIHHIREGARDRDVSRLARVLAGEAVGLVLGGGGARGFAHVGVIRALRQFGIPIDWVGGSSIGAVFAAAVAMDLDPEEIEVLARKAFVDENPLGDYTVPLVALLRGARLKRLVLQHFDRDIEDLPIPYFCVSCHMDRGALNVHERGRLWRAVRASVSLPGVLPPAVVGEQLAIDGGILNNLPVDVMRARSVGSVLAVDLSVYKERTVDYEEVPEPLELLRHRVLPFGRRQRVPNIVSLMMKATLVASAAHSRAMHDQADLVFTPPVGSFGLLDLRAFDRIVDVGYQHACEKLEAWERGGRPEESLGSPSQAGRGQGFERRRTVIATQPGAHRASL